MNKETLEEAAKTYRKTIPNSTYGDELGFIDGAKWQQEQDKNKYSEEDMKLAFEAGIRKSHSYKTHSECWKEWFEQYKNK
jgi:hypothetical protein